MGNQQCKFTQKLYNKYDFIQFMNQPMIGPIKIYRKKQPFYDYLMLVERWVYQQEIKRYSYQLEEIDKRLKGQDQALLLKVYGKEIIIDTLKNCAKKSKFKLYIEFYNYTLKSLINHRNQHKSKFTLDQIMYILDCIIKIFNFFEKIEALELSFHSSQIFVTPDGEIKFNPLQIFPKQQAYDVDCVEANCMPTKFKRTFRIKDKLIVFEIKKILNELTEFCDPTLPEDRNIFILKKRINCCDNIKQIGGIMLPSSIDRLEFNPKHIAKSQEQTTKICKNSPQVSNSQFSYSSKISVKNFAKQSRKQYRPYSYQQHYP